MMQWVYGIAALLGFVGASLSTFDAECATADAAACCLYASLAEQVQEQPKALPLRALVFGSETCQPCKTLHDAIVKELPGKGWRIGPTASDHIEFVDVAKDRARAGKYGVTLTPTTVIVDESGAQRAKVIGGMSAEFFAKWCGEKGLKP